MTARSMLRLLGVTLATSALLTGCTIDTPERDNEHETGRLTSTVTITSTPVSSRMEAPGSASTPPSAESDESPGLITEVPPHTEPFALRIEEAVEQTISLHGGTAGIAFSDGFTEITAGDMGATAAWSTVKVPLAIAALRQDPAQAPNASAAIQWSDNAAAETLWASLGTPDQAGLAITGILREGGSNATANTTVTRSGFSPFGQTMWSPDDQARFAANLGCINGSGPVMQYMAMVEPSQSWGIGQLPAARFKGGWGPRPDGSYSIRQFGVTTDPESGQTTALAIIVSPGSGSFIDAQGMANTLISNVQSALSLAPATPC